MAKGFAARPPAGPYIDASVVVPADGADLPDGPCRALWVGGAGNVELVTVRGTTLTVTAIAAGTLLPICAARVRASLTTVGAGLILAFY